MWWERNVALTWFTTWSLRLALGVALMRLLHKNTFTFLSLIFAYTQPIQHLFYNKGNLVIKRARTNKETSGYIPPGSGIRYREEEGGAKSPSRHLEASWPGLTQPRSLTSRPTQCLVFLMYMSKLFSNSYAHSQHMNKFHPLSFT